MKISLKPAEGSEFAFSLLPEKIQAKYAAKYQSFDIISKGAVNVPKGTEVVEISWDGEFFGAAKKSLAGVDAGNWREPNSCVKTLRNWMNSRTELTLIISGTWINMDVTISSFEATPHGGYGDVSYSITFKKVRSLKIYTTKEAKIGKKKKTKSRTKKKKSSFGKNSKIHVVKTDETLCSIAWKNQTSWGKIYDKNKAAIEKEAKKRGLKSSDHGKRIWAGIKLTMP